MKIRDLPSYVRDTVLRLFPRRAPTGLIRIGNPGPDSPVLLTGNFTLTVRRVKDALEDLDAWLLVANSNGINVWCAAGGGHLTHHDVISVLRTTGIDEVVTHRELILPQLAATGVERRPIEDATGWRARWGPARLEDLPAVLTRGGQVHGRQRTILFPLWERLEMSSIWVVPMVVVLAAAAGLIGGWRTALAAATLIILTVGVIFAALPRRPGVRRVGWFTYAAGAVIGAAIGTGVLMLAGGWSSSSQTIVVATSALAMVLLSVDLTGTTPLYPSSVNTRAGTPAITLAEDRCTGAADCVAVCPCDVLRLEPSPVKAVISNPVACTACAACIVQCPEDALYFSFPDGRIVEPATIRATRLNLLGDRRIELSDSPT